MYKKISFRWPLITLPLGVITLLFIGTLSVRAQCGEPQPSSCKTCHAQQEPVTDNAVWHSNHASQDLCINCHGGNGSTMDKNLSHDALVAQPLSDIYTSCHRCHPNYAILAVPYAAALQITPSSVATPTPITPGYFSNGLPPNGIVMPSSLVSASSPLQPFLFLSGGLVLIILFCIGTCWLDRHHVKG